MGGTLFTGGAVVTMDPEAGDLERGDSDPQGAMLSTDVRGRAGSVRPHEAFRGKGAEGAGAASGGPSWLRPRPVRGLWS
jgi:hypothetical protein